MIDGVTEQRTRFRSAACGASRIAGPTRHLFAATFPAGNHPCSVDTPVTRRMTSWHWANITKTAWPWRLPQRSNESSTGRSGSACSERYRSLPLRRRRPRPNAARGSHIRSGCHRYIVPPSRRCGGSEHAGDGVFTNIEASSNRVVKLGPSGKPMAHCRLVGSNWSIVFVP
jgi:hypothetical protein